LESDRKVTAKTKQIMRGVGLIAGVIVLALVPPFWLLPKGKMSSMGDAINASLGIVTTLGILGALFQDALKSWLHPLSAELSLPRPEGVPEPTGDFVWHLRVKNTSAHGGVLENCRVVLTGIRRQNSSWDDFPVERTLRWAPSESHDLDATISSHRIVDFARLNTAARLPGEYNDRFFLTFYQYFDQQAGGYVPQGGALPSWVQAGETVEFKIEVRAKLYSQSYIVAVFWDGARPLNPDEMAEHVRITVREQSR
jgi:hypothetical protein